MTTLHTLENYEKTRFSVALIASVIVHMLLVWVMVFNKYEPEIREKTTPPIMDVVLLDDTQMPDETPDIGDDIKTLSNKKSSGHQLGAQDNKTRAAKSPNANKTQSQQQEPSLSKQAKKSEQAKQQDKPQTKIIDQNNINNPSLLSFEQTNDEVKQDNKDKKEVPFIPLANLLPPSSALAQLSRDFDRERRMKQLMSKEADIGINTREGKYAAYVQGMVGTLEDAWYYAEGTDASLDEYFSHNPDSSALKILIRISIKHNGELDSFKVIRPSPNPALNESAISAIYGAAPFRPLPSSWGLERINLYFTFDASKNTLTYQPNQRF